MDLTQMLNLSKEFVDEHLKESCKAHALAYLETDNEDFLKLIVLKLTVVVASPTTLCPMAAILYNIISLEQQGASWLDVCKRLVQTYKDSPDVLLGLSGAVDAVVAERFAISEENTFVQ